MGDADRSASRSRQEILRKALERIEELEARLAESARGSDDPIAVVGIGCRFPGSASDADSFWRLLRDGVDAVTEVPADRWPIDDYYDPRRDAAGKTYSRWGGYLPDLRGFDAAFFGIGEREAELLDPQQRLLLEVAWEALEHAGIAASRVRRTRTGVWIGITISEYLQLLQREVGLEELDALQMSGTVLNAAAGRLGYILGSHGPTIALDTACSSSLVAVHLACQSLRAGESDMALAGGVNALLLPDNYVLLSRWGMLSADGRCRTFDARADGFVRGEGAGIVVLKRAADARRDGDDVLALIRGSAVNQDGSSSGLTVPNGLAEQEVMREALRQAGIAPADVDYVEAHGTATSLGDSIEADAIGAVYGPGRQPSRPLLIGSVKTNLGHLESASGVAGLIKTILALRHGQIPPHLHFETPSSSIPWETLPLEVPRELRPWPRSDGPRRAAVSSFGFSGTNAHLVLEAGPEPPAPPEADRSLAHLLPLSARDEAALRELAGRHAARLRAGGLRLADACFSAGYGRSHLAERLALVASDPADLAGRLERFAADGSCPAGLRGRASTGRGPVLLLAQPAGDLSGLLASEEPLREALKECAETLAPHLDRPLTPESLAAGAETPLLDPDGLPWPDALWFTRALALARLWRALGIEPSAVLGDGPGEHAAACLSGALTTKGAVAILAARRRLDAGSSPEALDQAASSAAARPARLPWFSSVTGAAVPGGKAPDAGHWRQQAQGPSRLDEALAALHARGHRLFLATGPPPGTALPADCTQLGDAGDGEARARLLETVARLYVLGTEPRWTALDGGAGARRVALPTYPFQRRPYWIRKAARTEPSR